MNRDMKFRAWDKVHKEMIGWEKFKKEASMDWFEDDDLIIMQYTGLKDKNGVEIYEGDIVNMSGYKPGTYTVIWDSYRVAWWLKNIKKREKEYDDDYCQLLGAWQEGIREVIGNIYENKELIDV